MATNGYDPLAALAQQAKRRIVENATALGRATGLAPAHTLEDRAARVWDLPAKWELADTIHDEELGRSNGAHNDRGDAIRHAEWSRRTAAGAGPLFAEVAGIAHEARNVADSFAAHGSRVLDRFTDPRGAPEPYDRVRKPPPPGQTIDESGMDLHNNAEGRRAYLEGRPIDPANLQLRPRTSVASAMYRNPPVGREGLPRR